MKASQYSQGYPQKMWIIITILICLKRRKPIRQDLLKFKMSFILRKNLGHIKLFTGNIKKIELFEDSHLNKYIIKIKC